MAFRISKQKRAEIDAALYELTEAKSKLESAVSALNAATDEKWGEVESARDAYNAARENVVSIVDGEADDQQSAFDEKSESWQEGERGSATSEWIDSLRNIEEEIAELDLDKPDELSVDVQAGSDVTIEDEPNY